MASSQVLCSSGVNNTTTYKNTGIYPNDSKKDGERARGHDLRGTAEHTMFVLL